MGGGNIVQRDATLRLEDLQKNGLDGVEQLYATIYSGRGRMPGYGAECAPKLQVGRRGALPALCAPGAEAMPAAGRTGAGHWLLEQ